MPTLLNLKTKVLRTFWNGISSVRSSLIHLCLQRNSELCRITFLQNFMWVQICHALRSISWGVLKPYFKQVFSAKCTEAFSFFHATPLSSFVANSLPPLNTFTTFGNATILSDNGEWSSASLERFENPLKKLCNSSARSFVQQCLNTGCCVRDVLPLPLRKHKTTVNRRWKSETYCTSCLRESEYESTTKHFYFQYW